MSVPDSLSEPLPVPNAGSGFSASPDLCRSLVNASGAGAVPTGMRTVCAGILAAALLTACATSGGDAAPPTSRSPQASATQSPVGCLRSDGNCLGVLAAGRHTSASFAVFGVPGEGQLTYRSDEGTWANSLDHAAGYWFQPADEYAASNGDATLRGVYLFSDVAAAKQSYTSCPEESDTSVGTDAASLLRWVRRLPHLRTAELPALRTADGTARGVSVRAVPGAEGACYDNATVRTLVASRPGALDPYVWGITQHDRIDLYAEDLGGGHTVGILLYAPDGRITPAFRAAAEKLVVTFRFTEP